MRGIFAALVFFLLPEIAVAQTKNSSRGVIDARSAMPVAAISSSEPLKNNILKLNLTAIALKNISLQYERILTRKSAIALGARYAPSAALPFRSAIKKALTEEWNEDAPLEKIIDKAEFDNFAITPEYRVYLGRGYGKGFYIAPFYRFGIYNVKNIKVEYGNELPQQQVDLSGRFVTHTGGVLFGAQWQFAKSFTLDWWILGPSYGGGNGNTSGINSSDYTENEKEEIRKAVDALEISLTRKTVEITGNTVRLKLDGPWAGIRSAVTIGFRF